MGNRSFNVFRRLSDHFGLRHHVSVCLTVSVSKGPEGKDFDRWSVDGVSTGKQGNSGSTLHSDISIIVPRELGKPRVVSRQPNYPLML